MQWSKSYETGVPLLDIQHRELFRQMEILSERSKAGHVTDPLEFLEKHVEKHFRDEERLHAENGFPAHAEHCKMHKDFVATYRQLLEEYISRPGHQGLVNRMALEWLRRHILGPDMAFARYMRQRNRAREERKNPYTCLSPRPKPESSPRPEPHNWKTMREAARNAALQGFGEYPLCAQDAEVLRRVPAQALADELVRRSKNGESATPSSRMHTEKV